MLFELQRQASGQRAPGGQLAAGKVRIHWQFRTWQHREGSTRPCAFTTHDFRLTPGKALSRGMFLAFNCIRD